MIFKGITPLETWVRLGQDMYNIGHYVIGMTCLLLAVSRVQLHVNREPESFLRKAKRIIPNGLTRDGPLNIPQSLPLVSKSNI